MRPTLDRTIDLREQALDLFVQEKAEVHVQAAVVWLLAAERFDCRLAHDRDPTCTCAAGLVAMAEILFDLSEDENTRWRGGLGRPGRW